MGKKVNISENMLNEVISESIKRVIKEKKIDLSDYADANGYQEKFEYWKDYLINHAESIYKNDYLSHINTEFFINQRDDERKEIDRKIFHDRAINNIIELLRPYVVLSKHNQIKDKNDAEHNAYRIALQKVALRIAKKYDIDEDDF